MSKMLEYLRRELNGMKFIPISESENELVRESLEMGMHINHIEGIEPGPDTVAVFQMLLAAHAPQEIRDKIIDLHIRALAGSPMPAD